ncbi:MAG: MFS transporter, partial [Planctomycetaceae bacterium]|nr:MFS transporter [Planctomycetaceae bacterium]
LPSPPRQLQLKDRVLILVAAFLGWMFAGWQMNLLPLISSPATIDMVRSSVESEVGFAEYEVGVDAPQLAQLKKRLDTEVAKWFSRYIAAFLFGAAFGGWVFGWYADRAGRVRAMAISVAWYSSFTGLCYFVSSPMEMCVLRFVACMGIGGMWPAGVSLVSEAWPDVSRPTLAGLIGAAANVGIALQGFSFGTLGRLVPEWTLTESAWRWTTVVSACPVVLGLFTILYVPESPLWLSRRRQQGIAAAPVRTVLRPPLLKMTLAGIALGAIPLLGAWGAQKWMIPWAASVGKSIGNLQLKADVNTVWAIGATLGSLCGGWLAAGIGRRLTYFLVSLFSLILASFIFRFLDPSMGWKFMLPVFTLGLISTVYFGWLPLYLPELFPTEVRATGSGVSFNTGRVISAIVILSTTGLGAYFQDDFARIGSLTSWIYVAGMIVILFLPQTTHQISDSQG